MTASFFAPPFPASAASVSADPPRASAMTLPPHFAASLLPIERTSREVFFSFPSFVSQTTRTSAISWSLQDFYDRRSSESLRLFADEADDFLCGGDGIGAVDLSSFLLLRRVLE